MTFCFFMTCMCCYLSFCVTLTSGSVDTRGFCICSHVITLSQWKEGEKIAESGTGLAHFWMFTSFIGMCVCTYGEHESAKENTNQAPCLKAQEGEISRKRQIGLPRLQMQLCQDAMFSFFYVCFVFYFLLRRVYSIWNSVCPGIIQRLKSQ